MKKGDTVRQVMPAPIQGVVVAKEFDDSIDEFRFLVSFTDAEGSTQERWFSESQVEAV